MWQVTVNGTVSDQVFNPDITKMEVELECRILYGIQARLEIKWLDEIEESEEVQ